MWRAQCALVMNTSNVAFSNFCFTLYNFKVDQAGNILKCFDMIWYVVSTRKCQVGTDCELSLAVRKIIRKSPICLWIQGTHLNNSHNLVGFLV